MGSRPIHPVWTSYRGRRALSITTAAPRNRFESHLGCERNPALTKSGCQPREAESLRVSGEGASVNVGVASGLAEAALQTESAASRQLARNVAWLADLRRSPRVTISRRAANEKATEVIGGGVTSPIRTRT